jgi:FtsP/CotA-like multicopper oxidase with cupredoxin domain
MHNMAGPKCIRIHERLWDMFATFLRRVAPKCSAIAALAVFATFPLRAQSPPATDSLAIQANSNRTPGGKLDHGVLTLHLELRQADWYPESDDGHSMRVYAFGEEGQAPQVPGPLIRVPQGAEVHVTLRNLLPAAAVVHGMHQHPGEASDVVQVPAGAVRELQFSAGVPGTYQYWASAGGELNGGRPYREDSQLAGAFIVDPPGTVLPDRVFVIGLWRSQPNVVLSQDVPVINGKSWPYTERLTYAAGGPVRWRWINASDSVHPMHLHGSYYRVDSEGDGERDQVFEAAQQRMVVTHGMRPGTTMSTLWTPLPGRWIFHCHLVAHFLPEMTASNALVAQPERIHEHGSNHMAGLVLGITVTGKRQAVASHGRTRKLRLLVRERPARNGLPPGLGYQLEESHILVSQDVTAPGPPIVLERGRPVEITVVNQLHEPTAVHWHGMELESYYDGVVGWGIDARKITPAIAPNASFRVRFTPPRAGTFIYHAHLNDEVQLGSGLYGPLIVVEPGAKLSSASDNIFLVSRGGANEVTAPRLLNGSAEDPPTLYWQRGQRYRLRLIDITANNPALFSLKGSGGLVRWRAVAKDGADLPPNQAVMQDSQQPLWSGETYDFEYEPQELGSLRLEVGSNPNATRPWRIVQRIEVQ